MSKNTLLTTTVTVANLISLVTKIVVKNDGNIYHHPYEGDAENKGVQAQIANDVGRALLESMERASSGLVKGAVKL